MEQEGLSESGSSGSEVSSSSGVDHGLPPRTHEVNSDSDSSSESSKKSSGLNKLSDVDSDSYERVNPIIRAARSVKRGLN